MWRDTWEYKRIIRNLNEYWLKQPDEKYVTVVMHFEHENGAHTVKEMMWVNPLYANDVKTRDECVKLLQMGTGISCDEVQDAVVPSGWMVSV